MTSSVQPPVVASDAKPVPRFRTQVLRRSSESLPPSLKPFFVRDISKRSKARAAYLILRNGSLVATVGEFGEGLDEDLFAATLDVIQNFMRTSFPVLRGTFLRTIEHGDTRILIERGKYSYLAVLVVGPEEESLRVRMRRELDAFESHNQPVLASLVERPELERQPEGAGELLNVLVPRGRLFQSSGA